MIRRIAAACGALLIALAGCAAPAYVVEEDGAARAWVLGSAEDSMEARVSGTARWLAGPRCWVLESGTGHSTGIIWPQGATVSDNPSTVEVGDQRIVDGARVTGTGGFTELPPEMEEFEIPSECRTGGVAVISQLDE